MTAWYQCRGNFSWEIWYHDQQLGFRRILWDNVEAQNFPLPAYTRAKWMPFRLAIVVSNNPISVINVHFLHQKPAHNNAHWKKSNRLLLTTVASRNGIHSSLVLAAKGKFWTAPLSHKMCPIKQTTKPKLLILVLCFSGEETPSTDTSNCMICIHILWEICRSVVIGPPCVAVFLKLSN